MVGAKERTCVFCKIKVLSDESEYLIRKAEEWHGFGFSLG